MLVVPSENQLHFWALDRNGRASLGTPADIERHLTILENTSASKMGLQLYLVIAKLECDNPFPSWVYSTVSSKAYKSMHLGGSGQDYLLSTTNIEEKLIYLGKILERLEIRNLIIHAQHFQYKKKYLAQMFSDCLPNAKILIENEGLGNNWGSRIDELLTIFQECPDFGLCLDICHVAETGIHGLNEFFEEKELCSRIEEVSASYCPRPAGSELIDPYEHAGFFGYRPNHALFTLSNKTLSEQEFNFIDQLPIVLEGVVPKEDTAHELLITELKYFQQRGGY